MNDPEPVLLKLTSLDEVNRLLAEHGISEQELPAILEREQLRKWHADTQAAYNLIWSAVTEFVPPNQEPDYPDVFTIVGAIDDIDRLRELVVMFAQSDALHVRERDEAAVSELAAGFEAAGRSTA